MRPKAASKVERVLFIPDCHHPFVDAKAWKLLLKVAGAWEPHRVVILGDFADCYEISDHDKDPGRKYNFKSEIGATNAALDQVQALRPKRIDYVMGNHEFRMDRYTIRRCPELHAFVNIADMLSLSKRGIHVTPYRRSIRVGKFYVTHDRKDAGKDAHRKTMAKYGNHNTIIGHTHRMAAHYQGDATGETHAGFMFGWLGDAESIDYDHRDSVHEWTLGFGTGLLSAEGNMLIRMHPIVNYNVEIDGVVVR